MTELTSRERMLRALDLREPDHIPCCFMSFSILRKRHNHNRYEVVKAQRAMGLDAMTIKSRVRKTRSSACRRISMHCGIC